MGRFRVVIAGGGVAGIEALLALHELAGDRVAVTLLAPEDEFVYRPLSVTEPFDLAGPRRFSLHEIASEHDARFQRGALARIDGRRMRALTGKGAELEYDALLVAIGALPVEAVPGSLTFRGPADTLMLRTLLDAVAQGRVARLAFAIPPDAAWPLPLYELALLTSARVEELERAVELHLVSPEPRPLDIFGARASASVERLLEDAGVALHLGRPPVAFNAGALELGDGARVECDRVVALPTLVGPSLPGLPRTGAFGLVPTGRYAQVDRLERVYAAGDVTSFPIKQGGISAQQADIAARSIAAAAGARVAPQPFRPILRGALITGRAPRYLRAEPDLGLGPGTSVAARSVLWWPPAKLAGRLLAPYLAAKAGYARLGPNELVDVEPPYGDEGKGLSAEHDDVVELALTSASTSARWGDFEGAMRWLEVAEDLELYLPPTFESKRVAWRELATRAPG
jgi:sulfide:quinone oxidoreductase